MTLAVVQPQYADAGYLAARRAINASRTFAGLLTAARALYDYEPESVERNALCALMGDAVARLWPNTPKRMPERRPGRPRKVA